MESSIINIFLKNISNLLSILSIFITIYLGVFYVPSWLEDTQKQKIKTAELTIEQSVKELIYQDSVSSYQEFIPLVKATEIDLDQGYPLSLDQILMKVQLSFMNDKFLPLEKRRGLIKEISALRKTIPTDHPLTEKKKSSVNLLSILSIFITLLAASAASYSIILRFKKEKDSEEEISNQVAGTSFSTPIAIHAVQFEYNILNAIQNFPGVEINSTARTTDFGYDAEFRFRQTQYYLEVKYLQKSKVGLSSLVNFINHIKGLEGEFWFVHNMELTNMAKSKYLEFQKTAGPGRTLSLIYAESAEQFEKMLPQLLDE